eukprot:scaffold39229_cov60-Attheya_sp.AAC.4
MRSVRNRNSNILLRRPQPHPYYNHDSPYMYGWFFGRRMYMRVFLLCCVVVVVSRFATVSATTTAVAPIEGSAIRETDPNIVPRNRPRVVNHHPFDDHLRPTPKQQATARPSITTTDPLLRRMLALTKTEKKKQKKQRHTEKTEDAGVTVYYDMTSPNNNDETTTSSPTSSGSSESLTLFTSTTTSTTYTPTTTRSPTISPPTLASSSQSPSTNVSTLENDKTTTSEEISLEKGQGFASTTRTASSDNFNVELSVAVLVPKEIVQDESTEFTESKPREIQLNVVHALEELVERNLHMMVLGRRRARTLWRRRPDLDSNNDMTETQNEMLQTTTTASTTQSTDNSTQEEKELRDGSMGDESSGNEFQEPGSGFLDSVTEEFTTLIYEREESTAIIKYVTTSSLYKDDSICWIMMSINFNMLNFRGSSKNVEEEEIPFPPANDESVSNNSEFSAVFKQSCYAHSWFPSASLDNNDDASSVTGSDALFASIYDSDDVSNNL